MLFPVLPISGHNIFKPIYYRHLNVKVNLETQSAVLFDNITRDNTNVFVFNLISILILIYKNKPARLGNIGLRRIGGCSGTFAEDGYVLTCSCYMNSLNLCGSFGIGDKVIRNGDVVLGWIERLDN
jgi:hypothetical protein